MALQQPDNRLPATGTPDPTLVEAGASTVHAPERWSGSAAVPPAGSRKRARRLRRIQRLAPAEPPAMQPDDWAAIPAVDPWAGHDLVWEADPPVPPPPRPTSPAPNPAPHRPPPVPPTLTRAAPQQLPAVPKSRPTTTGPAAGGRPMPSPGPQRPHIAPPGPQRPGVPPPPRGRRRRRRRLVLLVVLGLTLWYAVPATLDRYPALRQYPVSAALPDSFSDLYLRDDDSSKRAAERLARQLHGAADDSVFAGVYADGRGKRVTVFGVTGWRLTPGTDVRGQLQRLAPDYVLDDVTAFDVGQVGAHESCGIGRDDGAAVVVCAWADHGSLATVLLTRRSLSDSADLVRRLRSAVLTPA